MLRAMIFDLDDTLYEEETYILDGFRQVAHQFELAGVVPGGFFRELELVYRDGVRGRIFDEALLRAKVPPDPGLIGGMVEFYRAHSPNISLYSDAARLLDLLSGKYLLGLLSDGYALVQNKKIDALNIRHLFQSIVLSDQLGGRMTWKPSTIPYETMIDSLHVSSHQAVYIADNPAKDFVAPRQMGWLTIHVKRARGQYSGLDPQPGFEADFQVSNLLQVPDILTITQEQIPQIAQNS